MRRILFEQDDVCYQPDTPVDSFDQVVTEQRIFRHPSRQAALERVQIVDALANVNPFAEQILVGVGHGPGVWIQADVPGKDAGEAGDVSAGRSDFDARLQQGIPGDNGATARVELGAIQRMRERGDKPVPGFARHDRIGIQGDDVLDFP